MELIKGLLALAIVIGVPFLVIGGVLMLIAILWGYISAKRDYKKYGCTYDEYRDRKFWDNIEERTGHRKGNPWSNIKKK